MNLLKKTKRSSVDSYEKKHCQVQYCTTTRTQRVPTLKNIPYLLNLSLPPPRPPSSQKSPIPTIFFNLNIPYSDRFLAFWLRLVSRPRATVKYHCTTYGTCVSTIRGRHKTVSAVCSLEKRSVGFFGFVFDSFFVQHRITTNFCSF